MKVKVYFATSDGILLGEDADKRRFYPFTTVTFSPQEELVCPFCGKPLEDLSCSCEEFKRKLALLQEANGDKEHSSSLHYGVKMEYNRKIEDLSVQSLSASKIKELASDFWDDMVLCISTFPKKKCWVSLGTYQDGKVQFYCKDFSTKKVYFCTIAIELKGPEIALTSFKEVFVPGYSGRIGDYRFDQKEHTYVSFDGWDGVCQALKNV